MLLIRNNRRNITVYWSLLASVMNHHKPEWHKTIEIYSFTVLKVQSLKSMNHLSYVSMFLLKSSERNLFLCLFQFTEVACISWVVAPSSCYSNFFLLSSHLLLTIIF